MTTFADLDKRAPAIPSPTCPALDSLIREIDAAAKTLTDLTERRGEIEILRADNDALRGVGKYWREAADELCSEITGLEQQVAVLETQLKERAVV